MALPGGMLRTLRSIVVFGWLLFVPLSVEAGNGPNGNLHIPGEVLIKYKASSILNERKTGVPICGAKVVRKFSKLGIEHLKLPPSMTTEQAVELLSKDPNIEYAEPNYLVTISTLPNDSHFDKQWSLRNTGQKIAGVPGLPGADISAHLGWDKEIGDGAVVVAVIDSGIDWQHPDLADNIWINHGEVPGNGVDDDGNGFIDDIRGWDFVHNDSDPTDPHGHGTHVAGTIGAKGDNFIGVAGVAWNVRLMPLRAFAADGFGTTADIVAAIDYAIRNGARVINASYGKTLYSQSEFDALAEAQDAGILVVAAAGNSRTNVDDSPFYPASYRASQRENDERFLRNIVSVAATDNLDQLADFSSFGPVSVDVAAPGSYIFNTAPTQTEVSRFGVDQGDVEGWTLDEPWGVVANSAKVDSFFLTDSPDGKYRQNIDISATSPTIAVDGRTGLVLNFLLKGRAIKNKDFLYVQVCSDGQWTTLPVRVGNTLFTWGISGPFWNWTPAQADLGLLDKVERLSIRFRLVTEETITREGFLIDSIRIVANDELSSANGDYNYMSGTSMAVPHVVGLAALLWSQYPAMDHLEVKQAILEHVDPLQSLSGKVQTGGRINVARSLNILAPYSFDRDDTDPLIDEERSTPSSSGGGGGGGCTHDSSANFGFEWLLLILGIRFFRVGASLTFPIPPLHMDENPTRSRRRKGGSLHGPVSIPAPGERLSSAGRPRRKSGQKAL
jgi:subtilisin family serine protease